jgi:hypothetical protein
MLGRIAVPTTFNRFAWPTRCLFFFGRGPNPDYAGICLVGADPSFYADSLFPPDIVGKSFDADRSSNASKTLLADRAPQSR